MRNRVFLPLLPAGALTLAITTLMVSAFPASAVLLGGADWLYESDRTGAQLGESVCTAGDVNADGFDDVIIGVPRYSNGQTNEGAVYLFLGSSSGLSTTPNWVYESNSAGALLGCSVSTAGSVNADYADDFVVGAKGFGGHGKVFLFFGNTGGLPSSAPAWQYESSDYVALGSVVAYGGYIDGEVGAHVQADILVGDPSAAGGGAVLVFFTHTSIPGTVPDVVLHSPSPNAEFGASVACAFDVNADGHDDVVVGAPGNDEGELDAGAVYVYHGSSGGLDSAPAQILRSSTPGERFGASVAGLGSVNGDAYSDVLVGSPGLNTSHTHDGRAQIFAGSIDGIVDTPVWFQNFSQNLAEFGSAVATAGDVNGDGVADFMVGIPGFDGSGDPDQGKVQVFLGSTGTIAHTPVFEFQGGSDTAFLGTSTSTAGDVNGDGYSDLLAGAPGFDHPQVDEGRAVVYHGSANIYCGAPSWSVEGQVNGVHLGSRVTSAGDLDASGYSDLLVGSSGYSNGQVNEGRVGLYYGLRNAPALLPGWKFESDQAEAQLEFGVGVGDLDGSGVGDLLLAAYLYDGAHADDGRVWYFQSTSSGPPSTPTRIYSGESAGAWFGFSIAGLGDAIGSTEPDVAVGSPKYSGDFSMNGKVYVYAGAGTGLPAAPTWTYAGTQASAQVGWVVADAGDPLREASAGKNDLLVSAPWWSNGETSEGRVFLFRGMWTSFDSSPTLTLEENQSSALFGFSAAGIGDFNGDGYSDVAVGAPFYSGGETAEGRVYLYFGGPAMDAVADWTVESDVAGELFGSYVGSPGDVNGDGYSDLLVGAPYYSNGESHEGQFSLFLGSPSPISTVPVWVTESNVVNGVLGATAAQQLDLNGDNLSDIVVGIGTWSNGQTEEGQARAYFGSCASGISRLPSIRRFLLDQRILLHGVSDRGNAIRLGLRGTSAAGRDAMSMEWQVSDAADALLSIKTGTTQFVDTGEPDQEGFSQFDVLDVASGLTPQHDYSWRARISSRCPFFPRTAWLNMPGDGPGEADFGTGSPNAVTSTPPIDRPAELRLWPVSPNPARGEVAIRYELARATKVRLDIFDSGGRRVRQVFEDMRPRGAATVDWDGRDQDGRAVASGVYLVRMSAGGEEATQKFVFKR